MISVSPKIFFLAQPDMHEGTPDDPGMVQWLEHIGGEEAVACLEHVDGADIEQLIELLARRCYKSYAPGLNPNVTKVRTNSAEYHANIAKQRHGSVVANGGMVTYAFEDVSRVFCFHPDVEILTLTGWRRSADLVLSDVLLTKNPDTGVSRWSSPKSIQHFPYEGELLYWENSQITSPPVTPDHLLWAAPYDHHRGASTEEIAKKAQKIRASELFGREPLSGTKTYLKPRARRFVVDHAIDFHGEDLHEIRIGEHTYPTEAFMEWLGWQATDGGISEDGKRVEITQTKPQGQARLEELFSSLFSGHFRVYGDKHKLYRVHDPALNQFCRDHLGRLKSERTFSPWLLGLSDRLLAKFFAGAMGGDGNVTNESAHQVLYCNNESTAKQWQVVLARLGQSSNVREDNRVGRMETASVVNGVPIIQTRPSYLLSVHKKGASMVKRSQHKRMQYKGFVYCPETQDGLVYARYAGQAVWIGNTHEIVRNSIGNERSQESLRYVRLTNIRFWVPPIIASEETAKAIPLPPDFYSDRMNDVGLNGGPRYDMTPTDIFEHVVATCEWAQYSLASYYDIDNIKDFELKKKLTSAFRRVAPIGLATGIGMSFNLRSLRWIIEQRTSRHAEEEIRIVFGMVAEDAMKRWPQIFQDFTRVDTGGGLFEYVPAYSKI